MALIRLTSADWSFVSRKGNKYPAGLLKESFNAMVKGKLSYNTKSGKTYFRGENIASFVHKSDIPQDYSRNDVIEWMFMGEINNGASMLSRGYKVT